MHLHRHKQTSTQCLVCPWDELCLRRLQLHFIESYMREADGGFSGLDDAAREKLMEELYVEVNR